MKPITINFGLVASKRFPEYAQRRVLTDCITEHCLGAAEDITDCICNHLERVGCVIEEATMFKLSNSAEPTLVIKMLYPFTAEREACKPPSVLKYEPYMRLYEVATFFAQDCVAVLPEGEEGLLVGAFTKEYGAFDPDKFITLD